MLVKQGGKIAIETIQKNFFSVKHQIESPMVQCKCSSECKN